MTGDDFLDIESLEGQADIMGRVKSAIEAIGSVDAESDDGLVRVSVNVAGVILSMELDEATVRLDRRELADLIGDTARLAAAKASALVTAELAELQRRQQLLLDQFETLDHSAASALREITAATSPTVQQPPPDHLDVFPLYDRPRSDNDTDEW